MSQLWDLSRIVSREDVMLEGDTIPVSARLMALADVFDALVSRRVYKPPMSVDMAVTLISEGRGSQFDPDVVDAFVSARPVFAAIAARYPDSTDALAQKSDQVASGIHAPPLAASPAAPGGAPDNP